MKNLLIILSILILGACSSSMKVAYDVDKTVDFSQFKTAKYYGWQNKSDSIMNRFDKERIENAFNSEFKQRGITVTDDENANTDLIVSLYVLSEQKILKTADTQHSGGASVGDFYGPGWTWGNTSNTTRFSEHEYELGILIVSVYDNAKKELIWQGIGEDVVDIKAEKRDKKIPKLVAEIMKNFPKTPLQ